MAPQFGFFSASSALSMRPKQILPQRYADPALQQSLFRQSKELYRTILGPEAVLALGL